MRGMNEPLILPFTRDGDFARSVCEAVSETGATVLVARDVRDAIERHILRAELPIELISKTMTALAEVTWT
jgi:hypothetical protein